MFSQALEEDFVESRREGQDQMTVDDFHSLLTLARSDLCFRSLTYIGADRNVRERPMQNGTSHGWIRGHSVRGQG